MDTTHLPGRESVLSPVEKRLVEITNFAMCAMSVEEIALILGENLEKFEQSVSDQSSAEGSAFLRGQLLAKAAIHKSIIDCAKAGSHPAQQMALKLLRTTSRSNEHS
jgi:hypothetical protein